MIRRLMLTLAAAALWLSCGAQNLMSKDSTLSGTLLLKRWAKSAQSYCAGGSDYYVLKAENGAEFVLARDKDEAYPKAFADWQDKTVVLYGAFVEKIIATPADNRSQHPVGDDKDAFACRVFVVKRFVPAPVFEAKPVGKE